MNEEKNEWTLNERSSKELRKKDRERKYPFFADTCKGKHSIKVDKQQHLLHVLTHTNRIWSFICYFSMFYHTTLHPTYVYPYSWMLISWKEIFWAIRTITLICGVFSGLLLQCLMTCLVFNIEAVCRNTEQYIYIVMVIRM